MLRISLSDCFSTYNLEIHAVGMDIQTQLLTQPSVSGSDGITLEDALGRVSVLPYTFFKNWQVSAPPLNIFPEVLEKLMYDQDF